MKKTGMITGFFQQLLINPLNLISNCP